VRITIVSMGLIALATFPTNAEHLQRCARGNVIVSDDLKIVCSATWQFNGTCLGKDIWDNWKVTGQTNPEDSFVRPWESFSITVIGYELVKLLAENPDPKIDQTNDRLSWFMVGSGIYPQQDAMIWLAPGETRSRQIWPSGTGQIWPSKDDARKQPKEDIVDLHGYCVGGGPVTVFLTIYYTPSSVPPTRLPQSK
jgi:hypothetical protein